MTTEDRMNRIARVLRELTQALDDMDREHKANAAAFNDRTYVLAERTRILEEQHRALEQEGLRTSETIRGLINSVSELQADVERIGNT